MRRIVASLSGWLVLALAVLALLCWKLDALRTPEVLCVAPSSGLIDDKEYECVLPLEALHKEMGNYYIYVVEESRSYFHPVTARRMEVTFLAGSSTRAAIPGIPMDSRVVRFASRTLTGTSVPVTIWEEERRE